ncbi:MAG TPA: hypothetical protein VFP92_08895 [Rhodanobacteraceae bacterium]|nr:hypothetical protein [Rhodanobacteraceae bacterium]
MKHFLALVCVVSFLVCCTSGRAHGTVQCDAPPGMPGAEILLFGETHGSAESPALVGEVVCAYAKQGPVALGLEMPSTEEAPIGVYLASDGDGDARGKLRSAPFWLHQDGRSSVAMFDLIEWVRHLKHGGLPVSVFTLNPNLARTSDDNRAIAQALRAFHAKHPARRIVALMGNLHAGQAKISPFGSTIVPAGYLLRDLHPVSVYVANPGGSIWACMGTCGVHEVGGHWYPGRKPGFYADSPVQGYSMSYMLPGLTASPPAGESAGTGRQAMDGRQ